MIYWPQLNSAAQPLKHASALVLLVWLADSAPLADAMAACNPGQVIPSVTPILPWSLTHDSIFTCDETSHTSITERENHIQGT